MPPPGMQSPSLRRKSLGPLGALATKAAGRTSPTLLEAQPLLAKPVVILPAAKAKPQKVLVPPRVAPPKPSSALFKPVQPPQDGPRNTSQYGNGTGKGNGMHELTVDMLAAHGSLRLGINNSDAMDEDDDAERDGCEASLLAPVPPSPPPEVPVGTKAGNYSFFGLLVIGFFWVSGGCYGNEELFATAPPIVVLPCLLMMPIFYSLPLSLITTELTAMMPFDGGLVSWVHHIFGPKIGGHNSYCLFTSFLIDTSIYPLMAGNYINTRLADTNAFVQAVGREQVAPLLASGVVIIVTVIKFLGNDMLVNFNAVLIVISMLPIILFVGWTMPDWSPTDWSLANGEIKLSLLVAWQIWLYSGFASLGSLASEVSNPGPTMIRVIIVLTPVVVLVNCLPLVAALSQDKNYSSYTVGTFSDVAAEMGGSWLGIWIAIGAQMVMIGLFNGGSMVTERSVAQLMCSRFSSLTNEGSKASSRTWRWMVDDMTLGVGPIFILGSSFLTLCLVWLPYTLLVEVGVMVTTLPGVLQLLVFIYLRIYQPDTPRPYKIPFGTLGVILCTTPVMFLTLAYFVIGLIDKEPAVIVGHKIHYLKPISFAVITLGGIIVHIIWRLLRGDRSAEEMERHVRAEWARQQNG